MQMMRKAFIWLYTIQYPCIFLNVNSIKISQQQPSVMNSISMMWNFEDGRNGWGKSNPIEMGLDLEEINGDLRGMILPSATISNAFVDSPELRIEIDADERDFLVIRMLYQGDCDIASVSVERNSKETKIDPGIRKERTIFHDPVEIPFELHPNAVTPEIYYIPLWKYLTGTIHRIRFHPCRKQEKTVNRRQKDGQSFHIDWIALAKAPVITKVRGCIDKYYELMDDTPNLNCTVHKRLTNGYHESMAFECFPMQLPLASTYNCVREGGERISISGKHFGSSDAIVTIDGVECLDVVHVIPEVELQCTLPPSVSPLGAASKVVVRNGQLHLLYDEMSVLTYAARVSSLSIPVISNVASHALDINWKAPTSVWESLTVTGYIIRWKLKDDLKSLFPEENYVVVGNVTSTTLINLQPNTAYEIKIAALTEDQRKPEWQDIDLYGRRTMISDAIIGFDSPIATATTLSLDFNFSSFSAYNLLNQTNISAVKPLATLGPTGEVGGQGHFGLYVNGDTNIQNCNSSVTCCDGFDASQSNAVAKCTFMCSVTEGRVSTYINRVTDRTIPTNAVSAHPFPAKTVQNVADGTNIVIEKAPITAGCGPALRLTASASFLTGSAWYPRQMNIREGFDTKFAFRLSNPSTYCKVMDDTHTNCRSRGGEGFAFVIQNENEIAIGSGGMELGYGKLSNALSVEFDTWFNYELLDGYENQISIHVGGKNKTTHANHTYSLGATTSIPDLTDGIHVARITYLPNMEDYVPFMDHFVASTYAGNFFSGVNWISGSGVISVYLNDMNTPVLSVPLRVESAIELNHGRAWVGFTASTGEISWQAHDILSWSYSSLRVDPKYYTPILIDE